MCLRAIPEVGLDIDSRTFTTIMGAFPTGVVIVTTADEDGVPHGVTVNSMCSVSLDPPLLLFCLALTSQTLPVLRRRGRFAVNFLAEGRGRLSNRFAGKSARKFDNVRWRRSESGNVILHRDVVAYVECVVREAIVAGDHMVVIGQAVAGSKPGMDDQPLLYFRRTYDQWPVPMPLPGAGGRPAARDAGDAPGAGKCVALK